MNAFATCCHFGPRPERPASLDSWTSTLQTSYVNSGNLTQCIFLSRNHRLCRPSPGVWCMSVCRPHEAAGLGQISMPPVIPPAHSDRTCWANCHASSTSRFCYITRCQPQVSSVWIIFPSDFRPGGRRFGAPALRRLSRGHGIPYIPCANRQTTTLPRGNLSVCGIIGVPWQFPGQGSMF